MARAATEFLSLMRSHGSVFIVTGRAGTQTIYFDRIMFWNADRSGHQDWE